MLRLASQRTQQVPEAAPADFQGLPIPKRDVSTAAGLGRDFRHRVQVNQRGTGNAKKAGRIEAAFQIVERRVHPILTVIRHQACETPFGTEIEHARFADYPTVRASADQKARR